MKIFITGAAGFVGKNLIEKFSNKYELLTPTHKDLDLLNEAEVAEFLASHKPDAVIHCANIGATRKTDALPIIVDHNVRMFLNLARNSEYFGKMIFYGSGAELDKRENLVKVTEDYKSKSLPVTQYGFSKYLCSHFLEHFPKVINLRIFGIYGKYDDYENRFLSNLICRAVLGLPLVVFQDAIMDFILVDDLVNITEYFLNNKATRNFYNVCSGASERLLKLAELVKEISGKNLEIIVKEPGMAKEYTCNNNRMKSEIPSLKFTEIEQSLKSLYAWYEQNQNLINPDKLSA